MPLIGKPAPAFTAKAVVGGEIVDVTLEQYRGKYVVLVFYPLDWTFVCPSEIIAFSDRAAEFEAIGAQVLAISVDSEYSHYAWNQQTRKQGGLGSVVIPLVSDLNKTISAAYDVLEPNAGIAYRGTIIIDPQGTVRISHVQDFPIGRSVDETLRLLSAIQFHAQHGEVCPANWTKGAPTIIDNPQASKAYFAAVNK